MQARYFQLTVTEILKTQKYPRLGITQFLIKEGIARLEEVRGKDGKLENLFVRVKLPSSIKRTLLIQLITGRQEEGFGRRSKRGWQVVDRPTRWERSNRYFILTSFVNLIYVCPVRKSTADGAGAREFYTALTKPIEGWEGEIRDLVLKKRLVSCTESSGRTFNDCCGSLGRLLCSQTLSSSMMKCNWKSTSLQQLVSLKASSSVDFDKDVQKRFE